MDISKIIEAAGGLGAVAHVTGLTVDAIRKWPKIGIPDRHWGVLIGLAGGRLTPAILHVANEGARAVGTQTDGALAGAGALARPGS
jgi:hypothetical protein